MKKIKSNRIPAALPLGPITSNTIILIKNNMWRLVKKTKYIQKPMKPPIKASW